jgi:hypothetical protein
MNTAHFVVQEVFAGKLGFEAMRLVPAATVGTTPSGSPSPGRG